MRKLLNIDANPKTVKGQKKGYMTAVLYLAPYNVSGYMMCPFAESSGCWQTCLNTAGRGGMPMHGQFRAPGGQILPDNPIQHARIARTKLWMEERDTFEIQLVHEIQLHVARAKRKGFIPTVRLNGTSDIQWEKHVSERYGTTILEQFPDVQFYDYTKIPKRMYEPLPKNYYLCYSYSAASNRAQYDGYRMEQSGRSVVMVARNNDVKARIMQEAITDGYPAVDGDEHDLRFLDPPGARVVLKAKGLAKKETSGFILD